jgi:hypothetical protein
MLSTYLEEQIIFEDIIKKEKYKLDKEIVEI